MSANGIPGAYVVTANAAGVPTPITFSLSNIGTSGLALTVSASQSTISGPGQSIVFTYTVRNTGTLAATGVSLIDAKVSGITCPATTLAPAGTMTCTATYVSTAADVTNGIGIVSVARVTGTTIIGAAASPNVTTPVAIDAAGIRQKTVDANKGLMLNRAQALTSMAPNAQRLHNRLTASIFGEPDPDADAQTAPPAGRHEPLKAFDDELCGPVGQLVLRNRGAGPFGLLRMVDDRCGGRFENIDDVIPEVERAAFMLAYQQAAGFAKDRLNLAPRTIPEGARVVRVPV